MNQKTKVLDAVKNPTWQRTRVSMKGTPTEKKLRILREYFEDTEHDQYYDRSDAAMDYADKNHSSHRWFNCRVCLRVDNYLKALARGGQLPPGVGVNEVRRVGWSLRILK